MTLLVSTLVDEINSSMHSYVRDQDQVTTLTASMTDSDTSMTVDDATQVSRGLVQVGDEMVYVKMIDAAANSVVLEPWGRGEESSVAVAHSSGEKVTNSPIYPRVRVRDVLNGIVQEVFPDIFAVVEELITPVAAQSNYTLPADTYQVLSVENQEPGPSGEWRPVRVWRQNRAVGGVELEIQSPVFPGTDRVRATLVRDRPPAFAFTDDLEDWGYTSSIRDLLVLGSVARLIAYTEPSRIQVTAVESHARSASVPAGSATALSRYLYGLFRQRVEDERRQLLTRYPIQAHRTR